MNFPNSPQHPTFKKLQITLSYLVTAGELNKEGAA